MPAALEAESVVAGYGKVEVLHGVSLAVPDATVVALLGPNGAGKTTLLRAISGTLGITSGAIRLHGRRIDRRPPNERARRGITLIPEGRGIFPALTVRENIEIAARAGAGRRDEGARAAAVERIVRSFPRLGERLQQQAGTLSGGEQQMLSLGRALACDPRVLMMDEISMGLAPIIVDQLFEQVAELKAAGTTILLVEQYLTHALRFADICYVLNKGTVAFVGEPAELRSGDALAGYVG